MLLRITSKRQITLPAHVLDATGVGPGDNIELIETPDGYLLRRGASTARASELSAGGFQTATHRSTFSHSASSPMIRLCDSNGPKSPRSASIRKHPSPLNRRTASIFKQVAHDAMTDLKHTTTRACEGLDGVDGVIIAPSFSPPAPSHKSRGISRWQSD